MIQENCVAYQKTKFPFSETSVFITVFIPFGLCLPSSRKDPIIVPRPSLAATLHLSLQAQIVTHTFILEAVAGEWICMHVFWLADKTFP